MDYKPQETVDIDEITHGVKPRRSSRPKKKPIKYGQTEKLSTNEDTDKTQTSTPIKGSKCTARFQPGPSAQGVSTQGQEDNSREDRPFQGQTQEPEETEPTSLLAGDQVLEISVQSQKGRERERERERTKSSRVKDLDKLLTNFVIPLRENVVHE